MNHAFTISPDITEKMIRSVPEPAWTRTWHPISHGRVLDVMEKAFENQGVGTKARGYALSEDGMKFYGAWVTENSSGDTGRCILFRNAIDKTMSYALNGGTHTWMCSNLMVFGGFMEFKRHMADITDDLLLEITLRGLGTITDRADQISRWHEALHDVKMTEDAAKAFSYDLIQEKLLSQKRLPVFHDFLFGDEPRYDRTELWGLHGATTELMNDLSFSRNFQMKQDGLYELISERFGKKLPDLSKIISMAPVSAN